ncbi:ABC-2 type transport system permease protein [Pullulanibacillus pueri]|uniref:Transport permease protein n=1 Tax=Pullulanibacillus pueri TaxID=1437324 RepID=A0A8J2ZUN3_9BACL|nr:ABC transporter permease [Pullulanibacillus pueri]MBM7680806.1 ABC-2 type transport system permease protein [Pullulanibacillus pueri]GGH78407.1 transport permease protein [Pullulanibacillus pueri]
MKDVIWLIKNLFKVTFKDKKKLFFTVGLPIIGILVSILIYGGSNTSTLHVGIVNHDHSMISSNTVKFIKGLDHVQVKEIKAADVEDKVSSGQLDCVVTFDKGYTQSIQNGHPDHVNIVSIKGATVTGFVKSYLNQYIDNINDLSLAGKGDQETFHRLYTDYQQAPFKMTTGTLNDTSKNNDMTYQAIGFLLMFMLIAAGNLSSMITQEKEGRTYFRLLSTPIDSKKYVLSNIITNLLIMIGQIIVTLIFMTKVFHIQLSMPVWEMFVTLILFALVAVGLSLAVIAFATSSAAGNAMLNLIVTPSCLLSGCFFPSGIMPETVQKIAHFLPQTWLLDTIDKLQQGQHFSQVYLNIFILLAFACAFFLIAVYKFGRNNNVNNFI